MSINLFENDYLHKPTPESFKKSEKKVVFKPYNQNESYLFPKNTDDYIEKNHIARFLSLVIDKVNINFIFDKYNGGGASAYHPKMMLKIWLLAFIYRIYSSRKLAKALKESLPFIWISGNQQPDFRTINNFRKSLGEDMKKVFKNIIRMAINSGIIKGEDVFIDHTKIEANANRHKIVWKKQVTKQLKKIDTELDIIFTEVEKINHQEDKVWGDRDFSIDDISSMDETKINEIIEAVNIQLKKKRIERKDASDIKQKLRRIRDLFRNKTIYLWKNSILNGRNSFSKTDPDAVAMRQKDHVSIKLSYKKALP